jgi:carboxynorspermidine decarboxylase
MAQDPTPPLTEERLAALAAIPFEAVPSPGFVVHLGRLQENCALLKSVADNAGVNILLALKGFACFATFPLIARYLKGTTSSGLHEALLARDHFDGEVHVYSPAFKEADLQTLFGFAHSLVFNSPAQLTAGLALAAAQPGVGRPEFGLRLNPECSTGEVDLYDPCAAGSRLGTTRKALLKALESNPQLLDEVEGFHFHTLCEQDADALEVTIEAFEEKFAQWLPQRKWFNFGGGHHITRPGYDLERLQRILREFRQRHAGEVYLEPGEAVALHTGLLVTTVLDILENDGERLVILDTSATCHMPDVLEMPYRPRILNAGEADALGHNYRMGGLSCLAGDSIGVYSFAEPLRIGQRIVFLDMAHYTMVKTTTFNGVPLPSICTFDPDGEGLKVVRSFDHSDYATRLS